MARRAAPVTKGRTPPKKPTVSDAAPPGPARRGAKSKRQDDSAMELAPPVSILSDEDQDVHEPEAPPAKARRGRKPKADAVTTESVETADAVAPVEAEPLAPEPPDSEPELPALEAEAPKPPAPPRKTRRNREPEASAPPPLDIADEPPVEAHAPAAQWHSETGTVTFDWPAIEQVAAAEGPNQPMAKLLLAARTEGATSRWPF